MGEYMSMGFSWDDITSIFGTNRDLPQTEMPIVSLPAESVAIQRPVYDINAMLSQNFTLGNLCVTNQALSQPNLPNQSYQYDNLVYTADVIEQLNHEVGPFQILSGFRTKELQNKLSSQGEPTSAGMSFHEAGRAVDVYPTTMTIADMFGRILANEALRSQFAEIAIKPEQNALHLAVNVPGDVRQPKITGLTSGGVYARLNADEIASYIAPFMESFDDAYDYAAAKLVTTSRTPLILALVAAVGGVAYLALASGKRTTQRNPRVKIKPMKQKFEHTGNLSHLSDKALHIFIEKYKGQKSENGTSIITPQMKVAFAREELARRKKRNLKKNPSLGEDPDHDNAKFRARKDKFMRHKNLLGPKQKK